MTSAAMHENRPRQFRKTDTLPFVKAPQAERPVELRRLDVSLRVTGIYAETTQEMHLFNPNSRSLSGGLIVPLPDAAVVCGYARYLEMRAEYHQSPSFFLDCGDLFFRQGDRERGIRILSNLLEIGLQEPALMRICAWRLQQEGELDRAITLFEQVASIRDDEPQSHRDLALALADRWQRDNNLADLNRAVDLLYTVVCRSWGRFPEIELIALMELNRLLFFAACKGTAVASTIDERLIKNLDLDLRISLSWDADNTDVDLHVFEPTGEHAYYGHQLTAIGGLVSRDVRDGYGPEEYVLRRARSGAYTIKAHYFSYWQQKICGPCTVTATVFTNFARENETKRVITLRLDHSGDDYVWAWWISELPTAIAKNCSTTIC